ncbi:hypothetical protein ACIBI8_15455 [Streptomyces sp. NPDC050529]|uniref:hypothetical protein n=1 Tax=Streptomyces sp. NPDC050529 TaxID=3365624 RepID=UPI0037977408
MTSRHNGRYERHLSVETALPGIVRLAEIHGVADRTIRRALLDLRERGPIETLPYKGSYVVDVLPSTGGGADR